MRRTWRCGAVAFLFLVSPLFAAAPAGAMTIVRVSDEALVDQAARIVVGEVAESGEAAGDDGTELRVRVERTLKGDEAEEIVVRLPGGTSAAGVVRRIEGVPALAPGERVLVFLEPHPRGEWRLLHLAQGAFREELAGGRRWAIRDLDRVLELRRVGDGVEAGAAVEREPRRDFDAFTDWVAARVAGEAADASYLAAPTTGTPSRVGGRFNLFADPEDGTLLRWFAFDSGGFVPWRFFHTGQEGVTGGGSAEFQTAMDAWNEEPETPVDLRLAGATTATGGLVIFDDLNVILFGDPNDELPGFSCTFGGTLALGGAGYFFSPRLFHGTTYYELVEGDIVLNDGIACFFADSPDASKAAEELFAHELGHTLGIAHSEVGQALMNAFVHDDGRGALLHADDVAALRALYAVPEPVEPPEPCDPAEEICLLDDRFRVELVWINDPPNPRTPPDWPSGGTATLALAHPDGDGTGLDLVFLDLHDPQSPEVMLEMIDASGFDGHMWLFAAALTDVGFELTITDTVTGADKTYGKPQGTPGFAISDTQAFAAALSSPATSPLGASAAAFAPCAADALCLHEGRFEVRVSFVNHHFGGGGIGMPIPFSESSGLFAFFQEDQPDLLVNLIDATAWSGRFWLHAGGLTDLEWELEVRDTSTGATWSYRQPTFLFLPLLHQAAFPPPLAIELAVDGADADATPGPALPTGSPLTLTYQVTNLSDEEVSGIRVEDDQVAEVVCPATSLAAGATMTCTASAAVAAGAQRHEARAVARLDEADLGSPPDAAHYVGAAVVVEVPALGGVGTALLALLLLAAGWSIIRRAG